MRRARECRRAWPSSPSSTTTTWSSTAPATRTGRPRAGSSREGAQVLVALPETVERLRTVAAAAVDAGAGTGHAAGRADLPGSLPRHVADNLRGGGRRCRRVARPAPSRPDRGPGGRTGVPTVAAPAGHRSRPRSASPGSTTRWPPPRRACSRRSTPTRASASPLLLGGRDRGQPVDRLVAALARAARGDGAAGGGDRRPLRRGTRSTPGWAAGAGRHRGRRGGRGGRAPRATSTSACCRPAAASYDQFRDHPPKGRRSRRRSPRSAGRAARP